MKKVILSIIITLFVSAIALSLSYDNNEYQQKSREYSVLAQTAYDDGDYDNAIEYARLSEENAELSKTYIEFMLARSEAEKNLYTARTRLSWAKSKNAEQFFPSAVMTAVQSIDISAGLFSADDFEGSLQESNAALAALSVVREITPLPAEYQVDLWADSKDCLWNIAGNPAVYGNPFLWEELYDANRSGLKRPSNPNLLMPGMIVKIPSIKGEYREGRYDPSIKYESFKSLTSQ